VLCWERGGGGGCARRLGRGGGGFAFQSDVDNGRKIWRDGMEGVFLRYMRMTVACVPELWSVFPRGTVVESGEQCFFMR